MAGPAMTGQAIPAQKSTFLHWYDTHFPRKFSHSRWKLARNGGLSDTALTCGG
ncbi:hypothetical protein AB1K70_07070 [Bremerella sp. JC770]|uniref:hypothetical protein n=1 Tax=Bremerella sp. JC770 TaxID=3232137 RepID=UPI0034590F71